ncbi:MAG: aminoacyl-tRNA hydrolase [Thermodesulfobacteriota bacterium]
MPDFLFPGPWSLTPDPSMEAMWLIVGLGNPGAEYVWTRHNLGFQVIAVLGEMWHIALQKRSHEAVWGQGRVQGEGVILAQPMTYMNLSGRAVAQLLRYWRLPVEALVVIHDDLDVPGGRLKIVDRGGAGGHQGVLSIQNALGTEDFLRVKLGVGRPPAGVAPEDFVLSHFPREEAEAITHLVVRAAQAVDTLVREGLAAAQNQFHGAAG